MSKTLSTLKPRILKPWLASIAYIVILVLSIGFFFPDSHFPVWLEFVLKSAAVLAFLLIVLVPLSHVLFRFGQKKRSKTLVTAAYTTIAGYMLLFGILLYIRLKACDAVANTHDSRWHCNVSGKGLIVYFVLIPILAATLSVLFVGLGQMVQKTTRPKG